MVVVLSEIMSPGCCSAASCWETGVCLCVPKNSVRGQQATVTALQVAASLNIFIQGGAFHDSYSGFCGDEGFKFYSLLMCSYKQAILSL